MTQAVTTTPLSREHVHILGQKKSCSFFCQGHLQGGKSLPWSGKERVNFCRFYCEQHLWLVISCGCFISCYFYSHQVVQAWSILKAGRNFWMYPLKNVPWVLDGLGGFCQWKCSLEMEGDGCWCQGRVRSPLWRCLRWVQSSRADPADMTWGDGSCLACTCLAAHPLDLACLSHRKQVTSEEVTLVLNFP